MTELTKLGKYELRHELGKGAMGVVYEGFDPFIERTVAIKTVLKSSLDDSKAQGMLGRFRREAQAAGRLSHPNIVSIYDYGDDQDVAFIVMEFVQGKELKKYFDSEERFALPDILRIMSQLLEALEYSHRHGVVHRDIKPANIIIAKNGMVKVADFGIAKIESSHMTQVGTVLGTPTHMSPEQFMGQAVDLRTDIYSSGVILYQFLTGDRPFAGSVVTIMHKAINRDPVPPSQLNAEIPAAMDNIVKKAMAKRAEDRYQTAREFLTDLKLAVEGFPLAVSEVAPVVTSTPAKTINSEATIDSTDERMADAASLDALNARQKMDAEQAARDLAVVEAGAKIAAEVRRQKELEEQAARDAVASKVDPKIEADVRRKRKEAEKLWRKQDAAKARTRVNAEAKANAKVGGKIKKKVDMGQTMIMPSAASLENAAISNKKLRSKLMAFGAVLLGLLLGTWFAMRTSPESKPVVAVPEKPAAQHSVPVVVPSVVKSQPTAIVPSGSKAQDKPPALVKPVEQVKQVEQVKSAPGKVAPSAQVESKVGAKALAEKQSQAKADALRIAHAKAETEARAKAAAEVRRKLAADAQVKSKAVMRTKKIETDTLIQIGIGAADGAPAGTKR